MAAYMITYDLNSTGQKYSDVIEAIKDASTGAWCTYWKSSYMIKSNLTADQISDKITPHLDQNDRMIIVEVKTTNYQGWLEKSEWDYIKKNILN